MKSASTIQQPTAFFTDDSASRYEDTATKLKIDKHLTDINDVITEEDIRNINTNITLGMIQSASTE